MNIYGDMSIQYASTLDLLKKVAAFGRNARGVSIRYRFKSFGVCRFQTQNATAIMQALTQKLPAIMWDSFVTQKV